MQLVARPLLDVGRVVQPLLLRVQPAQLDIQRVLLRAELADLPALGDVLAHRVGESQHDRADHRREDRGPAGEPRPRSVLSGLAHQAPAAVNRGNAPAPAYAAASSSSSSIRSSWLYLATRSDRQGAPVLIWPQFSATARSAIVVSSVSPDL